MHYSPFRPKQTKPIAKMLVRGQRLCKHCGYVLPSDAKKCPKCGKPREPRD